MAHDDVRREPDVAAARRSMTRPGPGRRPGALVAVVWLVVALVFPAVPGAAGVAYRGDTIYSARELDRILGVNASRTPDGAELAARIPDLLRRYLADGYLDARVRLIREGPELIVDVEAGEPVVVAGTILTGAPDELASRLEEVMGSRPNAPLSERELATGLERTVAVLVEEGYPFAASEAMDFSRDGSSLIYRLRIEPGAAVRVDSLSISGLDVTRLDTAWRIARFQPGERFRESDRRAIRGRLVRSGIFSRVGEVGLKLLPGSESGVYDVAVDEAPSTILHGVVGVGGQEQTLTGLLDVTVTNLFGTAREFSARWEGRGNGRQRYLLGYREPWILGLPLAVAGRFSQDQEDTLYTRTDWLADVEFTVVERLTLRGGWQSEKSVTPAGFLRRSRRASTRFGLRWDGRDDLAANMRGGLIDLTGSRGTQTEDYRDGSELERRVITLETRSELHLPVGRQSGLFVGGLGFFRDAPGEELRAENLFAVGGVGSLRGYEERRFRTGQGGVVTLEARRYIGADGSRTFVFVDAAYLDPARSLGIGGDPWKLAAGIGFRVASRVGLLGVDLAASEEIRSYDEIRLHLSVEGRY